MELMSPRTCERGCKSLSFSPCLVEGVETLGLELGITSKTNTKRQEREKRSGHQRKASRWVRARKIGRASRDSLRHGRRTSILGLGKARQDCQFLSGQWKPGEKAVHSSQRELREFCSTGLLRARLGSTGIISLIYGSGGCRDEPSPVLLVAPALGL